MKRDGEIRLRELPSGRFYVLAEGRSKTSFIIDETGRVRDLIKSNRGETGLDGTTLVEDPSGNVFGIVEYRPDFSKSAVKLVIYGLTKGGRPRSHRVPMNFMNHRFLHLRDGRTLFIAIGQGGRGAVTEPDSERLYVYDLFKDESYSQDISSWNMGIFAGAYETEQGGVELIYRDREGDWGTSLRRAQIYGHAPK